MRVAGVDCPAALRGRRTFPAGLLAPRAVLTSATTPEAPLNLRAGEIVEVRSRAEILATLDRQGRLDALPFMPEMLQYCGRRLRVFRRADRTCDTIEGSGARRMRHVVHLDGIRCDGSAHGGCQAACLIYWNEAWLKRPGGASLPSRRERDRLGAGSAEADSCTADRLLRATRRASSAADEPTFSCQATEVLRATSRLRWWDVRQYVRELWTGNVGIREAVVVIALAALNVLRRRFGRRPYPMVAGTLKQTPMEKLDLQPGDLVEIKSKAEIARTLDRRNRNRGLFFDVEMVPYCGRRARVLRRVERIIDERTGTMRRLPSDCVMLDGVVCQGRFSRYRLLCPRSIYSFWREIWLRRVEPEKQ